MPRGPRLDAPGTFHHVMVRGIEGRPLFRDDRDREDFVRRLGTLAKSGAVTVYAWSLLTNHCHFLVRSGARPLGAVMRSLLTGYACAFNRRHRRAGHLFQNRYKSIVIEEEPYFLELVRYLHLNPLRAGVVSDLKALDRSPWSGHAALMGQRTVPWQDTETVLARFSARRRRARELYRAFVEAGVAQGRRSDLQGGGLVRSAGGWAAVQTLRRGREGWAADERILGSGEFVEAIKREAALQAQHTTRPRPSGAFPDLIRQCARAWGVSSAELVSGSRRRVVAHARAVASCVAVRELTLPIAAVAHALGISPSAVRMGLTKGDGLLAARGMTVADLFQAARRKVR